jgi:hypothetical protein
VWPFVARPVSVETTKSPVTIGVTQMRRILFVLLCTVAATAQAQSRARISLAGFKEPIAIEDVSTPFTIDASAGKTFAALRAAFGELKIPLDVVDSAGGLIGNAKLSGVSIFAGQRLGKLFDCGSSAGGANNADSYRLSIVLLALVDPAGANSTKMRIGFVASGKDIGGATKMAVTCGSTGALETKMAELVKATAK